MTAPQDPDLTALTAIFTARSEEIRARVAQRDGWLLAALVAAGAVALNAPVGSLAAPVLLLFLGMIWRQHDRRIGSSARYLREVIEPRLSGTIEPFETFLDQAEHSRSYRTRWSPSSLLSRLYFPLLQALLMAWGLYHYTIGHHPGGTFTWLVIALLVFDTLVIIYTLQHVKHIRVFDQSA